MFSQVILLTDKYESEGAHRGMLGYVIEVYPNGKYEVEFSDSETGISLAQIVADESELEVCPKR